MGSVCQIVRLRFGQGHPDTCRRSETGTRGSTTRCSRCRGRRAAGKRPTHGSPDDPPTRRWSRRSLTATRASPSAPRGYGRARRWPALQRQVGGENEIRGCELMFDLSSAIGKPFERHTTHRQWRGPDLPPGPPWSPPSRVRVVVHQAASNRSRSERNGNEGTPPTPASRGSLFAACGTLPAGWNLRGRPGLRGPGCLAAGRAESTRGHDDPASCAGLGPRVDAGPCAGHHANARHGWLCA